MTREQYLESIKADALDNLKQNCNLQTLIDYLMPYSDREALAISREVVEYLAGEEWRNRSQHRTAFDTIRETILDYLRTNEGGMVTGNTGNGYYYKTEAEALTALYEGEDTPEGYSNGWAVVKEALTEFDMLAELDPCNPCKMDVIARDYLLGEALDTITDEELAKWLHMPNKRDAQAVFGVINELSNLDYRLPEHWVEAINGTVKCISCRVLLELLILEEPKLTERAFENYKEYAEE